MLPALYNGTTPTNRLATLFDRFFADDPFFAPLAQPTARAWPAMPLSVWEDEDAVTVEIDAPGVAEGDIEVSVHQGELVVRGERKSTRTGAGYDSRTYGRFEQRLTLPATVDADRVEAKLANGVLSVTCPKSEAAKPRRIAIKA